LGLLTCILELRRKLSNQFVFELDGLIALIRKQPVLLDEIHSELIKSLLIFGNVKRLVEEDLELHQLSSKFGVSPS
jgi:hypothetical protein